MEQILLDTKIIHELKLSLYNASKMGGCFISCKIFLIVLNVIYLLLSIHMICLALWMKINNLAMKVTESIFLVTNLFNIVIINGVFLFFISVIGFIGTIKHHKKILLIYMIILFSIFVLQLTWSVASLSFPYWDLRYFIKTTWEAMKSGNDPEVLVYIERQGKDNQFKIVES